MVCAIVEYRMLRLPRKAFSVVRAAFNCLDVYYQQDWLEGMALQAYRVKSSR